MWIAAAIVILAVGVTSAFLKVEEQRYWERVAEQSGVDLQRTLAGLPSLAPIVQPWYLQVPVFVIIMVFILATVIGLLVAVVVRLDQRAHD